MVGKRLKELRKDKKITQINLAKLLGITESAISTYEHDKVEPTHKNLIRISNYFNVTVDYLLGIVDVPIPAYSTDKMLLFPNGINEAEIRFINEYVEFIRLKNTPVVEEPIKKRRKKRKSENRNT